MIEINLLPPEYKKRINIIGYLSDFLPYLLLVIPLILSLNLILGLLITKRAVSLKGVEYAWNKQEPSFKEINSLKEELAKLRKDYNNLNDLVYSKVKFSEIMYLLYSNLPLNVWFKELTYKDKILSIKGGALDLEKDASISLREYVNSLRETKISEDFSEIDVKSQELRRIKDKNVLFFDLQLTNEKK